VGREVLISVVIPAINEEKYIPQCLASLKAQDFTRPFEVIVVDNGSEDQTIQVARRWGAKVILCPRKGVSYARQAGAEVALGDIIIQADADTTYPSWWLSRIQKQFRKHPKIVAVAGIFIYNKPPWWAVFEYTFRFIFGFLSAVILGRPYIISGANLAFYKKAFSQIGGYQHASYSSDQYNISTRLSKVGKVIYDIRSYGVTSERSVSKPARVVTMDFISHLLRYAKYLFKFSGSEAKSSRNKTTSISTG
jgi:peptidoglycan-N-acetylglucosamine deacetylase